MQIATDNILISGKCDYLLLEAAKLAASQFKHIEVCYMCNVIMLLSILMIVRGCTQNTWSTTELTLMCVKNELQDILPQNVFEIVSDWFNRIKWNRRKYGSTGLIETNLLLSFCLLVVYQVLHRTINIIEIRSKTLKSDSASVNLSSWENQKWYWPKLRPKGLHPLRPNWRSSRLGPELYSQQLGSDVLTNNRRL